MFELHKDYNELHGGYCLTRIKAISTSIRGFSYAGSHYSINEDGLVCGYIGYWYDGATGPAIDTDNSLEGACFHDILYALIRIGVIPDTYYYRRKADLVLYTALRADGMSWLRANAWYVGVRLGGWTAI